MPPYERAAHLRAALTRRVPPCERAEESRRRREPCVERRAFARRVCAERLDECRRERECERAGERRVAGAAAASERARKRRAGARPGRPEYFETTGGAAMISNE